MIANRHLKQRTVLSTLLAMALFSITSCKLAQGQVPSPRLGLPGYQNPPVLNSADQNQIELGRKLFFDKRLSKDGSISCASCHQPEHAYADNKNLAQGVNQSSGTRNTPSILNAAYNRAQFWDGRRASLELQALDPLTNPAEHGLADQSELLRILRKDNQYKSLFETAFSNTAQSIDTQHVGEALAAFERNELLAGDSAFDRFYFAGDKSAMTPAAIRGLDLFRGQAQCVSCHTIQKDYALFSDNDYHSLSIGLKRIADRLPELTSRMVPLRGDPRQIDQAISRDRDIAELGRFSVTLKPADIGKFRTPGLRNVALTAPYMHDGSIPTLEEAIEQEVYYRGAESGHPLILTPSEKKDLLEFLKSLTSREIPKF